LNRKLDSNHSGAWKVAYADFVTAMMAVFMVLWILGQKPEVIASTTRYFKDPTDRSFQSPACTDKLLFGAMAEMVAGSRKESVVPTKAITANEGVMREAARDFTRLLNIKTEKENPVDVELTADGLKITLFNKDDKAIFKKSSTVLTAWGTFVLQNLASLIERYNFRVFIDGHTCLLAGEKNTAYGHWELSIDRANAARRAFEQFSVPSTKIERVTGYGDTAPAPGTDPNFPRNDRLTIQLAAQQSLPPEKSGAKPVGK